MLFPTIRGNPLLLRACRARGMRQSPHPRLSSSPNEYLSPMAKSQRTAVVLVAAGRGLRAGAGGPKQYREIGGVPVIYRAMVAFSRHADVFAVQPVVNPDDGAMFTAAVLGLSNEAPVKGGATRQASVLAGLEALARHKADIVLIHDAGRPFVSEGVAARTIDATPRPGAGFPAVPVTYPIKVTGKNGNVEDTPD